MVVVKSIRSTKAGLENLNPILQDNQIGYEEDTKRWKIGDGVKHYKELPYQAGESAYEIWLRHGNEGSEDDFLDSLKGMSAFEEACQTGHWVNTIVMSMLLVLKIYPWLSNMLLS